MRVLSLLSALDDGTLERLAQHHLGAEDEPRASRCANLESELRSAKNLRDSIYNLQPPAFKILELLLDSPDQSAPLAGLREWAMDETNALAERVSSETIAARVQGMRLYRRVFEEARRSDLTLDPSETALLAVLRRELGILQVEHFLVEHHAELQNFWKEEHAFLRAMERMRMGGLAFAVEGRLVLPEDFVVLIRRVLGLETSSDARKRLLSRVSSQEAGEMLQAFGLRFSGSKEEKLQRVFDNYIPPSAFLDALGIVRLRELCRELHVGTSGAKDELVDRLVKHFAADGDIAPPPAEPAPPPPEPRALDPEKFDAVFQSLRQQDLSDILAAIGSHRVTGSKEQLIRLVSESRFSETTLLMELGVKQLEALLSRLELRNGGTKSDKVARLLESFARSGPPQIDAVG